MLDYHGNVDDRTAIFEISSNVLRVSTPKVDVNQMDRMYELPEGYVLTPINRLDAEATALLEAAQAEAEVRGRHSARSDLILLVAVTGDNAIGNILRRSLPRTASIREVVNAEWEGGESFDDMPRDAVRQAIFAAVARTQPQEKVRPGAFIAALLRLADSRASRVVRRLGANPATVADRLENTGTP